MPDSNDIRIIRNLVARSQTTGRVASRFFEERYARLLLAMSLQEAKAILGFPPGAAPTPEEISKAYKRKAIENHPDRGGTHEKMVEVNVAKDVLEGKSRATWTPEPAPRRERPKPAPVEYGATLKGASFDEAYGSAGIPASVEWKFISIPEWYWPSSNSPGHRVWCLYGQNEHKHVFLAFKERGESAGGVWLDDQGKQAPPGTGKFTKIEQDWQSSLIEIPIAQNVAKIAPKYLKEVGTAWADGAKPKPPKKFVAWPGGKPTDTIIGKIPRSGGASLKDILVGTGLLSDEDPEVAGRKSVVEIFTKYSKERYERAKKLKAEGKKKMVSNADQYDFFVRVNGKTEKLDDDTITKMERSFIPWVLHWEISEGAPKNLTRMRGGRLKYGPAEAIRELANCLTGEPSWLHIAMEKAAEEYEDPVKTAMLALRDGYTLFEGARIAGMTPYDFFREVSRV